MQKLWNFAHYFVFIRSFSLFILENTISWYKIQLSVIFFLFERGKAWDFFINKSIDYIELSWICQVFYRFFFQSNSSKIEKTITKKNVQLNEFHFKWKAPFLLCPNSLISIVVEHIITSLYRFFGLQILYKHVKCN